MRNHPQKVMSDYFISMHHFGAVNAVIVNKTCIVEITLSLCASDEMYCRPI